MSNLPWYILRIIPRREIETERQMRKLGYPTICPYVEGRCRIHKTPRKWKFPLFPGYLFASWPDWNAGWNHVTDKIKTVYDYLGPQESTNPSILRLADVEYLQSIADGRYKAGEDPLRLRVGDNVLVADETSWFHEAAATIREIRGRNAIVEMHNMKMTDNVKISLAKLEKV